MTTWSQLSEPEKTKLLLKHPAKEIAEALENSLQKRWDNESGLYHTEECRRNGVLKLVRQALEPLLPDHEEKAREVYAQIPWPVAPKAFRPVPTFEGCMGLACATCGGTGVWGFISGQRCPDCEGGG